MFKNILIFGLLLIFCSTFNSEIIWDKYSLVNINMCPNPADPNLTLSKDPLFYQTNLPHTFSNGPYNKWCRKLGCDGGYQMPSYTVRTPYILAMSGFRFEVEWEWNKPNYTETGTKLNSNWCVYYNQNHCYSGGTEFGFCYRNRKQFEFYATCPFENYYDIPDHLRVKSKFHIPFTPANGMNYLNFTAMANDNGYVISLDSTIDNYKTIKTETYNVSYPPCYLDFRDSVGRITASMDTNFNKYTRDKINYKVIEYAIDTDFLPKDD